MKITIQETAQKTTQEKFTNIKNIVNQSISGIFLFFFKKIINLCKKLMIKILFI